MIKIFYYLGLGATATSIAGVEKALSVKEISELMTPTEEEKLKLPRSFAHNLRIIIDAEKREVKNQTGSFNVSKYSEQ